MAKKRTKRSRALVPADATDADLILEATHEATLLDMLDKLLNKGVVMNGDIVLGVAGVDLVYLRLSSLLCAIDRIMPGATTGRRRRHNRGPRRLRLPGE
jgi:hypothetical protein